MVRERGGMPVEAPLDDMVDRRSRHPISLAIHDEKFVLVIHSDAHRRAKAARERMKLAIGRDLHRPASIGRAHARHDAALDSAAAVAQIQREVEIALRVPDQTVGELMVVAVETPVAIDAVVKVRDAIAILIHQFRKFRALHDKDMAGLVIDKDSERLLQAAREDFPVTAAAVFFPRPHIAIPRAGVNGAVVREGDSARLECHALGRFHRFNSIARRQYLG